MASWVDDLLSSGPAIHGGPEVAFDSWKDVVERSVLSFHFDCDRPRSFKGAVHRQSLAGVNFVGMESEKHAAYRDRDTMCAADMGYYVMTLQMSGQLRMSQDDRTAVLRPGTFALYDSSRPATLVSSDDYRSVCLRFSKEWLGARHDDPLADVVATPFDTGTGLSSPVWGMALSLYRSLDSLGPSGPLAVRNLMDLVTTMLRTELGQRDVEGAPHREALLQRVREYIDTQLPDPELDPQAIAAAHYISTRYLHSLFESTNHTVAEWIRARRIELCRRDLADPRLRELSVAAIAVRWGFKRPSHFGQVFKRETGTTPAEFRREAAV